MATQDYAASVQGVAIRVTRLDASGALMNGPTDSYTSTSFIRVSFTPEYEEGDEITEKNADGTVCVSFKAPDTLKQVTMEIAICDPDPEFTTLVAGGLLLTKQVTPGDDANVKSVGWAASQVGADPSGNGVAVEVWSYAVVSGKKAPVDPYYHWVFPYVKLRQSGDRVIENGLLANTFEGTGLGNINYQSGPDGRWEWPSAADRPYMYSRTDWAPVSYRGFYTWDSDTPGEGVPVLTLPANAPGFNVPGETTFDVNEDPDTQLESDEDNPDTEAPTITTLSPTTGVAAGGTAVTINGTNFAGNSQLDVAFGGTAATDIHLVSDTKLTCTSPAHATGAVAVTVTTEDGTATKASPAFTYS